MHRLRSDLFAHLQRQSLGFFTRTRGGDVQSRLVNDIGSMQGVVTSTATSIAANVTVVIGTAVAMVALSWRLALLSLVVLPPAVYLTRQVARMRHQITAQRQRRLADLHVQIEEGLSVSGVLLTKTLGVGGALTTRFEETSADLVDLEIRSRLAGRWRMATMNIIFAAIPGRDLPRGRPARHQRRHDDRHPGRLHRPAGQPVPPADGPAQRRRRHHRLDGAVLADLRVRRPAGRPPGAGRPRAPSPASAARSASSTSASATTPAATCSPTSTSPCPPARASRSSARPAAASPRWPGWSPASTTRRAAPCWSTASTSATWRPPTSPRTVGMVTQETYLMHTSIRENLLHARPDATDEEIEDACRQAADP